MSKTDNQKETKSQGEATFPFGKIVGLRGLKGEVKVRPSTNSPEILVSVTHVKTKATKHFPSVELEVEDMHFDKRMFHLSFVDHPDRSSVEHLMGAELFTWEDQLEELAEEEFWVKDLVGMTVVKEDGEEVGRVVSIMYGGNDILEVRRDGDPKDKTILIPFVKSIVPHVHVAEKKIVVADLPGLLDYQ